MTARVSESHAQSEEECGKPGRCTLPGSRRLHDRCEEILKHCVSQLEIGWVARVDIWCASIRTLSFLAPQPAALIDDAEPDSESASESEESYYSGLQSEPDTEEEQVRTF